MNLKVNFIATRLLLTMAVIFLSPNFVVASLTNGEIDSAAKYAWGKNIGWVNFGAANGSVSVTDSALTGHAWSENYGWINLNPTTSGVTNNGYGDLAGHAWGENLGWIDFGEVAINSAGEFTGYAIIENNSSQISLNCSNTASCSSSDFKVKTDWRPRGTRPACNNSLDDDGDGKIDYSADPGCAGLTDESEVDQGAVISVPSAGQPAAPSTAAESLVKKNEPEAVKPEDQAGDKETAPEKDLENLSPSQAPLTLRGQGDGLLAEPIPAELTELAEKFPTLNKIFRELNITKNADVSRLIDVALILPGLSEMAGSPKIEIAPGIYGGSLAVPLADLSAEAKKNLPTEIVFAKTGGEMVDYNVYITIDKQGQPRQNIKTLVNQGLKLVVKPDGRVNSIKGHLVFKSAGQSAAPRSDNNSFGRLIRFVSAEERAPVTVEEKPVPEEFSYADSDGDGLWTADIKMPAAAGSYDIVTVLDYKDPKLGVKTIMLSTVIDPEGYVYEKFQGKELRLPGAMVFLYWLNPENKQYQLWPSDIYKQKNPQLTGLTGNYSFLVPSGFYYLKIEATGYPLYRGQPFEVKTGGGIHVNIELKAKYAWLKNLGWQIILLILAVLLLAYYFYRKKFRFKAASEMADINKENLPAKDASPVKDDQPRTEIGQEPKK